MQYRITITTFKGPYSHHICGQSLSLNQTNVSQRYTEELAAVLNTHVFLISGLCGDGDSFRFSHISPEEIDFDTCWVKVWLNPGNNHDLVLRRQESDTGHADHS